MLLTSTVSEANVRSAAKHESRSLGCRFKRRSPVTGDVSTGLMCIEVTDLS